MSTARHARPRHVPVGPPQRGRHRSPARPAVMHPALVGTAAAVVAVGGVAVLRSDPQRTGAASVVAAEPGPSATPGTRSTDSPAASRSGVRVPLTAEPAAPADPARAGGTGKHRKADPAPATAPATAVPAKDAAPVKVAAVDAAGPPALRKACGFTRSTQRTPDLNRTQRRNARTIVEVAQERGLPPRAAVIALATAQQESELLNINYGDRDSLGLFQQRPSQGWGRPSQVRNPTYAANKFYAVLVDVDGWRRLPLTVAAQRVQRSAFPNAYARWELLAASVVDDLLDVSDDALNCTRG